MATRCDFAMLAILQSFEPNPVEDLTPVKPSLNHLAGYTVALERGWSPDNVRGAKAAQEQLGRIGADPAGFVASLDDREAMGKPIQLPDGSMVPRLPGFARWIWDGEFCGSIGLRWQRGTSALPSHVLGHIGFAVVPWERGAGRAKQALAPMLPEARQQELDYIELTADPGNVASQRVIQACGGKLVERFRKVAAYGGLEALRFRIELRDGNHPALESG